MWFRHKKEHINNNDRYKTLINTILIQNPVPSKNRPDEVLFVIVTNEDTSTIYNRTITVIEFQKFTEILDLTPIDILNTIVKNIDSICNMLKHPDKFTFAIRHIFNSGEVWINNKKYNINSKLIADSISYNGNNYTITES